MRPGSPGDTRMTDTKASQIVADHINGITAGCVGASAQFQALVTTLPLGNVQDLATWAGITATPMAGWVCVRNLSNRYDKRSFVNVVETIQRGIDDGEMPASIRHLMMVADHEAARSPVSSPSFSGVPSRSAPNSP